MVLILCYLIIIASLGLAGWNVYFTHKYCEKTISIIKGYKGLA